VRQAPPLTQYEARCHADDLEAHLVEDSAPDDHTRLVLQHALDLARALGTRRVALPWRQAVSETGLSEAVVKRVLADGASGYLVLAERGMSGLRGRANLYWLRPPTSPVSGRCVGDAERELWGRQQAPLAAAESDRKRTA
jgi:hypothetical protein